MANFAVIDIETTGGLYNRDKIIEIAIIVTDGSQIIRKFSSLVYPERTIPPTITRITGIDDEMVQDSPRFFEIAKNVIEMTEGCIFVAHNAKFDYSFVKEEFASLGYAFNKKTLCTVKLTRSQVPGLSSYGLDNLIRHFDLVVTERHRAYGDAFATCEILQILMRQSEDQFHIKQIINHGIDATVLPAGIDIEQIHDAPERPGVYYLSDGQDRILYIGKAKNIKKRLFQHFRKLSRKSINIYNHVRKLHFRETGDELIALLLELHEIKTLRPEYNKSLRRTNYPFALYLKSPTKEDEAAFLIRRHNKQHDMRYRKIKLFGSKASAEGFVQNFIVEEEICKRHFASRSRAFTCSCEDSCHQFFEVKGYSIEDVAELLIDEFEEDFVVVLDGREETENSFVFVENGRFVGFGYLPCDIQLGHFDEWRDFLDEQFFYTETSGILKNFLKDNPRVLVKRT